MPTAKPKKNTPTKSKAAPKKMGRPSKFSNEMALKITAGLAEGRSLRSICAPDDMPSIVSVYAWLQLHEEFLKQYARARDDGADSIADDIHDITDMTLRGLYDPSAARVAIDGKKWVASKLKPKKYGDKLDIDQKNSGEITVNIKQFSEEPKDDGNNSTV